MTKLDFSEIGNHEDYVWCRRHNEWHKTWCRLQRSDYTFLCEARHKERYDKDPSYRYRVDQARKSHPYPAGTIRIDAARVQAIGYGMDPD